MFFKGYISPVSQPDPVPFTILASLGFLLLKTVLGVLLGKHLNLSLKLVAHSILLNSSLTVLMLSSHF